MNNCTICGKPIVLRPSAAERAARYGETAAFYTKLFTVHDTCLVNKRNEDTLALMRLNKEKS